MNNEIKRLIAQRLTERIGTFECPICHRGSFTILDGFVMNSIQDEPSQMIIGGGKRTISASLVCTNCGFTSMQNLIVIGFTIDELSRESQENQ